MPPVSGVLVVDKPPRLSSAAVVDRVKRALSTGKAGHAGTLDPMATGVLVVCLGDATKIATYLLADDKRYLATARLGEGTDTWDADGRVVETGPVPAVSADEVRTALQSFVGAIEQRPPAFSAIKKDGRPLYARARAGEVVEPPVRTVEIRALELVAWEPPDLVFRVDCGKGTYVRSLAVDVARRLGTLAHLTALRRERSGPFGLERAVAWPKVEGRDLPVLRGALIEPADALATLPRQDVDDAGVLALTRGQPVAASRQPLPTSPDAPVRLVGPAGALVAIGQRRGGQIWPVRVLQVDNQTPRG